MSYELLLQPERLSICRLDRGYDLPVGLWRSSFVSVSRTPDELSIVAPSEQVDRLVEGLPATGWSRVDGFRALRVAGTLAFELTGVLSALTAPLARAEISVFAVCTFDTDYILVNEASLETALRALVDAGFRVHEADEGSAGHRLQ